MKRKVLGLLLAACMLLCLVPLSAGAATSGSILALGTSALPGYDSETGSYNYIYYGNWKGEPVKWRVLDSKTNTGEDGLFLLSEVLFGRTNAGGIFFNGNEGATNAWQTSSARHWCVNEFTAFTDAEYSAILATYKSDAKNGGNFPAVANILSGDKVFFLSAAEATNSGYGFSDDASRVAYYNGNARSWFLRSQYVEAGYATIAAASGALRRCSIATGSGTARPAMNITADQILFSSPAVGGKKATGLTAVVGGMGSEQKLTIVDSERGGFAVMASQRSGNILLFTYDGAATGSNEYLSAMVVYGGKVTHYGRLKNLKEASQFGGTAMVTLPDGFDTAKGDRLYIFNEQCNGDYQTDYASPLRELSGAALAGNTLQVKIGEDNFWYVSNDGGETWTSLGVKATGADGKDGVNGKDGADGKDGTNGLDGKDGLNGIDGKDGLTPYIGENGNWWIGETDTGVPVTTKGEKGDPGAAGKDGIGIAKTEVNKDGELIVTYTDGATAKAGKVTSAAGRDGSDGVSIVNAEINENGELVLLYSDGRKVVLGKVVGQDGKDGVGIQKAEINENGELVLTYTDGREAVLGKVTATADHTLVIVALCLGGAALAGNIALGCYVLARKKRVPIEF